MQVINGECVKIMKGMESNSFSAIVTDPPYGLSDTRGECFNDIFFSTLFDIFLPKFNKRISKLIDGLDLGCPPGRVSLLNCVNRAVWIETGATMPEGSVSKNIDKAAGAKRAKVAYTKTKI